MSMFDATGGPAADTDRKENTVRKLDRMNRALRHQEPDRVPISDFFWGSFIERWRWASPVNATPPGGGSTGCRATFHRGA